MSQRNCHFKGKLCLKKLYYQNFSWRFVKVYKLSFYKVNQENNNPSYTDVNSQNDQPFVSPKKSIKINNNTNRAIDVTRNNFVSPSRFSVLNCDEVSSSVLGDEINISNVLKTRHNDTTRPIQDAVQNPRRPPLVINNSPENQHDFRRLKAVPGENSYSEAVEDHKGNEKIL